MSQNGTNEEVLDFLKTENLQRIDLEMIAFRMQDSAFFRAVTSLLAARHVYHPTLWSYAVRHNVPEQIQVYLEHANDFVAQCGTYLQSPLLKIDPVARYAYQHLDYRPLVNARAHRLGQRREIVNDRLLQQYRSLLAILCCQRELNDDQLMAVTYYMLLQDRVEEALAFFGRVNPDRLPTRLQYDYFTAYLDFFSPIPSWPAPIVQRYANYPVDRWRKAFARRSASNWPRFRASRTAVVESGRSATDADQPGRDGSELRIPGGSEEDHRPLPEPDVGPDQLLHHGHRTAVQPQSVCAAVHRPVLDDPAESHGDRRVAGGRQIAEVELPARCSTATCWWRSRVRA